MFESIIDMMIKTFFRALLLLILLPIYSIGQTVSLFETMDASKGKQFELQADELDRVYIKFNDELFKSRNPFSLESIDFDLDGQQRSFVVTKRVEYYPGIYSVIAKEIDSGSLFIGTVQGSRFTAKIHDHRRSVTSHIRYDESIEEHYLTSLNIEAMDLLGCALDDHNMDEFHSEAVYQATSQNIYGNPTDSESLQKSTFSTRKTDAISSISSLNDKTTIDILYVYTDAAEEFAKSCKFNGYSVCESITTIEAYLAQATILSQSAFDNSDIAIELRPVYNYKVDYDETADEIGSGARLRRLTTSKTFNPSNWNAGGYMDEVHDIRDEVGADMVAGIFNLSDVGGIAWLLGSPSGYPELAFSLNRIQQILTGYTLAHELGHNLGNAHSRSQASNTAGLYGALFHYSVGYQWVTENEAFVSVMGYSEDKETLSGDTVRTQEAGVFSSPTVLWQGVEAGTLDPVYGPTDASRSNKEIKLTISEYRPTVIAPPAISLDQEAVTVSMNREDSFEVPLVVSNNGESNLMWRVAAEPVGLSKAPEATEKQFLRPSEPLQSYEGIQSSDNKTIFTEDFENFKSRLIGGYRARQGWRTQSLDNLFAIKTNNPSSGTQHFQVRASEDSTYWVQSPFFGPQLEGTFDVSFDISVTKDRETNGFNYVDLRFYDGINGGLAAGIAIDSDLEFQTFNRAESGGSIIYNNTGEFFISNTAENDSYRTVRIKLNTTSSRIEYYIDDMLVDESMYLNAEVIDVFYVTMNGALHPLGLVDIDNIQIRRPYMYDWFDINDVAGAIEPNQQGTINLSFNTIGVEAGVYQTKLQLINNTVTSSVVEIPITLSVSTAVSNEEILMPNSFSLAPAYPNPFNPVTTLSYTLPRASFVTMDVFDVLGRKIQTLVQERVAAGTHTIQLDASTWASGQYIIRLSAGNYVTSQQITLMK